MLSSANDMAKYLQFRLNLGKVGTTQIVSKVRQEEHIYTKKYLIELFYFSKM